MKRSVCLLMIFIAAQLLSSLVMLFAFNIGNLFEAGNLDVNILAGNPTAQGLSLVLTLFVIWMVMEWLRWTDRKSFGTCGYGLKPYAVTLLGMIPVIFLVNLMLEPFELEDWNEQMFIRLATNPWGVLGIVVAGPVTEELVFRMGIQRHLIRKGLQPWYAMIVTSVVFGIIHGNLAQLFGAVPFGVVLGWLYWRSGTIWIPIAAHVFNNLVGVCTIWWAQDVTMVSLCGGWLYAAVIALLALVCVAAAVYYLNRKVFPVR